MIAAIHRGMPEKSLKDWLCCLESRHPVEIELGLDRVAAVASELEVLSSHIHTFTIAGTNGKGSVAAVLTAGLVAGGYCVGTYTSPHLLNFNERIQVDGEPVDDASIVAAFDAVESARKDIPLTYFETATLAALWIFNQTGVTQQVLEVGLGGRLDAVNIVDADISIITSIGLDHTDWLGDSRELVAVEKAGVARGGRPCIVADDDPPATLLAALNARGAIPQFIGRDWQIRAGRLTTVGGLTAVLPQPSGLFETNVGAALQAIESSGASELSEGLIAAVSAVSLPGRLTILEISGVRVILDVAHNTESVVRLVDFMRRHPCDGASHAIFGVMGDKPVHDMIHACAGIFDDWSAVDLRHIPRAMSAEDLAGAIGSGRVNTTGSFTEVWADVSQRCQSGDRVVVFGSFHTVTEALRLLVQQRGI